MAITQMHWSDLIDRRAKNTGGEKNGVIGYGRRKCSIRGRVANLFWGGKF